MSEEDVTISKLTFRVVAELDKSVGKYREQLEVLSHFTIVSHSFPTDLSTE